MSEPHNPLRIKRMYLFKKKMTEWMKGGWMDTSSIFSLKCPTNVPQWDSQLSVNRCHLLRRRNTKFAPCVNVADVKRSPPKLGFLRQLCFAPPVMWQFCQLFRSELQSTTCDFRVRGGVEEADSVRPPQLFLPTLKAHSGATTLASCCA